MKISHWCGEGESNSHHPSPKLDALAIKLPPRIKTKSPHTNVQGQKIKP